MAYILVQQSVEDFEKWKSLFDEDEPFREAGGSKGGLVLRNADDPNHVTVLLEWDSLESARAFASSDELRERMQRAGVTGPPALFFLNDAGKSPA